MSKVVHMFLGMMMIMGLVVGCQSMTGQPTEEYVDDASVTASVKTKLANQQPSSMARVEVETVKGVVHLSGVVQSDAEKAEAGRLTKQVKGVRRVDNDLTIQTHFENPS